MRSKVLREICVFAGTYFYRSLEKSQKLRPAKKKNLPHAISDLIKAVSVK